MSEAPENHYWEVVRTPTYTCPECGWKTFHAEDVKNRYCPMCHEFEEHRNLKRFIESQERERRD